MDKLVLVPGMFDVLHPGHIRFLHNARKLGDRLLVALSSDYAVSQAKGADRPVFTFYERRDMLLALRDVDEVVEVEGVAFTLIQQRQPAFVVKGEDWAGKKIREIQEVHDYGGQVVFIPFEDTWSTTSVIEKIRKESQ